MDKFKKAILEFDRQFSFKPIKFVNLDCLKNAKADAVIIVGMGGSGQVGDIIAGLREELNIPVPVICWKDYELPEIKFKNPFFIFISFSGNTEETLSGFREVKNKAAVCSGGKLLEMAEAEKTPAAIFKNLEIKARQESGLMFYGTIGILKSLFPKIKIQNFILNKSGLEKTGKEIAEKISNQIVLLYSSQKNAYLAYNWKTRLNETAKIPAFCGIIPEICHNEIEIFESKSFSPKISTIIIKDDSDTACVKEKIKKIEKIFKKNKIHSVAAKLKGRNSLEKIWNSLVLADWVSYYSAKINGIDPAKTEIIDALKALDFQA